MKRILAYGLLGATILASQSSIFAVEPTNVAVIATEPGNETQIDNMQAILDYRIELVCKELNKSIEEVTKQELLEAINKR